MVWQLDCDSSLVGSETRCPRSLDGASGKGSLTGRDGLMVELDGEPIQWPAWESMSSKHRKAHRLLLRFRTFR